MDKREERRDGGREIKKRLLARESCGGESNWV